MNDECIRNWTRKPGASLDEIERLESSLRIVLPEPYKRFLLDSNGGEGEIGELYLSAWSVSEIKEFNVGYKIWSRLGTDFVGIANEGDYCIALDYRTSRCAPMLVLFPLGGMDLGSISQLGLSYTEGVKRLATEQGIL